MARKQAKTDDTQQGHKPNLSPHHGVGGSYMNPGGVNHDHEQEPETQLVERTEDQVPRSVDEANPTEDEAAQ